MVGATIVMWSFAPSALANVSAGDASATRDYLLDELAQTRAEVADLPVALTAMEALRGQLQTECPGVLDGAPEPARGEKPSDSAVEIGEEEQATVFGEAERTELQLRRGFVHAIAHLAWRDHGLTRLVRVDAVAEVAQAETAAPELCSDMRAWVSSGYQTVTASTVSYVRRESTLSRETGAAQQLIAHKLERYENHADKRIAGQIAAVEKQAVETVLPKVLAALAQVSEVLRGAPAAPAS
jgi:hypothetical protein